GFFEITNRINGFTGLARLNSTGSWTVKSDLQSKQDVTTASNLLEKALSLNPINFYYKKQDLNELPHKLMGFIAQEVEEILPHAVAGTDSKYLDYNAIVPVAIGAIKEMKQCYDDKIANLEMQLEQLKKILLNSQMAA
ncbi:MAG: tail fiber domain-containing protein, partial [Waterburya sp.]